MKIRCLQYVHKSLELHTGKSDTEKKKTLSRQSCFPTFPSELQTVCESLEGCHLLQKVHLTGNPLQQESGWR